MTEVVTRDVRLDRLPVLTCWPEDGGPFLTLPLVYTEHPRAAAAHNLGIYRLQVHDARTTGMHWQIGKGGGFHYAVAEARGEALPVTVFLGGPPALILAAIAPLPENVPELMLASLLAGRKLPRRARAGAAPARRRRRVRARRPRAAAACAGPRGRSATTTATTRCATTTRCSRSSAHRAPPGRDLPGDGRRQAAAGGLLHRRPPAGAAVAALPAGDARRARPVVLRRDRLPLAGRGGGARALRARGDGRRRSASWARGSSRSPSSCCSPTRPVDLRDFPRHARARAGAHAARDRPLRLLATCRWTRSTTPGPRVNEGSKGVWLGLGDPRARAAARVRAGGRRRRRTSPTCASSAAAASWSAARLRRRSRRGRAARRPSGLRRLAAPRADRRAARAPRASAINFLWTTFTRFEPAADIHAARRASCATTCRTRRRC